MGQEVRDAGSVAWESLCARVDMIANATPDAVALRMGTKRLSYGTMCQAADRLAARLIRSGTGLEVLVGICLLRSFERIIAMMAVWKTGGAVLALDPAWPLERLRSLLRESQAPIVLATDALTPMLGNENLIALAINGDLCNPDATTTLVHPGPQGPDTLAYVVYTSGSTGLPKGVEVTHGNLQHLIAWHQTAFDLSATDKVSHVAGLGFDASFWEVWPALYAGASVVLIEEEARTSPALLRKWLLDQHVTVAFVPTVLAEIMLTLDWPKETPLRVLLTGGEALHVRPPPGLPFVVVNNYGPSECTVVATSGPVDANADEGLPDLGHPIARTQVYLLDDQGEPVADSEAGEIVIGGAGVARGYRNRPDLTQERFVPDRFQSAEGASQSAEGARMYRTGDIGRRLRDGRITFLSRIDEQEQIRGTRVEPAEVAAALSRHPQVEWCTVIGHGPPRDRRLIAYVLLSAPHTPPTADTLRGFLAEALPEAMIPSAYMRIAHVPLSTNGKLDRDALPMPDAAISLPQTGFRAAVKPTEVRLASMIGELLDGVTVGVDDNFFLLGGHSLLGTQVIMHVREAFGVQLSLRDLFEAPTVAELADRIAVLLSELLDTMTDEEAELWATS